MSMWPAPKNAVLVREPLDEQSERYETCNTPSCLCNAMPGDVLTPHRGFRPIHWNEFCGGSSRFKSFLSQNCPEYRLNQKRERTVACKRFAMIHLQTCLTSRELRELSSTCTMLALFRRSVKWSSLLFLSRISKSLFIAVSRMLKQSEPKTSGILTNLGRSGYDTVRGAYTYSSRTQSRTVEPSFY